MRALVFVVLAVAVVGTAAGAHHGSADYHVDREVTITGVVTEWRWANPHTWVFLAVTTPDGTMEEWDGEGPPLTWATQQGWSSETLRSGQTVSLVMYPSRRNPRGGLVKAIRRDTGELLPVSRPWLDR